jgi:hypothetical protein
LSYRANSKCCYGSIRKAQRIHARRSSMARHIDERLKAPTARVLNSGMHNLTVLICQTLTHQKIKKARFVLSHK